MGNRKNEKAKCKINQETVEESREEAKCGNEYSEDRVGGVACFARVAEGSIHAFLPWFGIHDYVHGITNGC